MSIKVGTKLGAYEIVSLLGCGGMGEVYKARDTRLDRLVALKVLPEEFASDAGRRHRFEQEARAVAALNHPNVVAVYDVGDDYFISELVDGESLRGVHLPVRSAIDVGAQIAEGLAAAHAAGIIHRDLKPENILLTNDGRAKILDFGLAKLDRIWKRDATQTVTEAGTVTGTAGYMSPEQVRGQAVDHRSDIFSFGLVLYELLSGKRAFQRETSAETMAAIVNEEMPELPSTIPGALSQIVSRCVEKQPANRFQNAKDLAFALRTLSGTQVAVAARARSRHVNGWKVAAVVLAVLLGSAVWALLRERTADTRPIRLSLNPPPTTTFGGTGAVVSPDGRMIAFTAGAPGKQSLWIRPLDSSDAKEIPGTDTATYPFWAPDSQSVAFFGAGKLKRVRVTGGAVEEVCNAPIGRGGAWNNDGVIVFAPAAGSGLQQVAASGGEPKALTQLDTARQETEHRWPQFLPDGQRFFYWILSGNAENRGIYVSSLSDPNQRIRIVATNFRAEYVPALGGATARLLWMRGESLVAQRFDPTALRLDGEPRPISDLVGTGALGFAHFSVSTNGVLVYGVGPLGKREIEWRDRQGMVLQKEGLAGVFYSPRFSPDDSRLALARVEPPNTDIWLHEFSRKVMTRLTVEPGFDNYPVWSPDGRKLVCSSSRGGPRNLYLRPAGGGGSEERLTESPHPHYPFDWSRDGRYVVYTEVHPTTAGDIWLIQLQGAGNKAKTEPFLVTPFDETNGRLSPDGKWIAYSSNESGRYEIYVQAFPATGVKSLVSSNSGTHPVWRGDGRELFYVAADGRLMTVEVKVESGGLSFSAARELFRIPVRLGVHIYDYDVTADGQRFIVLAPAVEGAPEPLSVLINWHSALEL
jgi:Tol biopolymer transport system component/predicted Ser/Thr protein kinase